jgi:hypothetical protein
MPTTENTLACNLSDYVTPNHFSVDQFEAFPGLSVDEEFDLVAPIVIFLRADSAKSKKARAALLKLQAMGHPLLNDVDVADVIKTGNGMGRAGTRYNALMMALADSVIPGIDSHIDSFGSFSFLVPGDNTLLCGDDCGTFSFHSSAQSVRERLADLT